MKKLFLCFVFLCFNTLFAVGSVSGTVKAEGGADLTGATITLFQNQILITSTTSTSGTYSFAGLDAGYYDMVVSDSSHATQVVGIDVVDLANTEEDFSLSTDYGSFTGTMYIANSITFLPGATVSAVRDNIVYGTTTSGVGGVFSLSGLPEGQYTMIASKTGYAFEIIPIYITEGETESFDMAISSTFLSIEGTVYDPSGTTGIEGVTLEVLQFGGVVSSLQSTAGGSYIIDGLTQGFEYTIRALGDSTYGASAISVWTLNPVNLTGQDINLSSNPGTINGTIFEPDGVTEVPNARVQLWADSSFISSVFSTSDGTYSFVGVTPGEYGLSAAANTYASSTEAVRISPSEADTTDITLGLSPGSISGRVYDLNSGQSLSNASIFALLNNDVIGFVISNFDGTYSFAGLPEGNYTVRFHPLGSQVKIFGSNLAAGGTNTLDAPTRRIPGTIKGTITEPDGTTSIAGAVVEVLQNNIVMLTSYTAPDGSYYMWGFATGSYIVRASDPDSIYATKSVGASVTEDQTTTIDISLVDAPGSIGGTITESGGSTPIGGARVVAKQNNDEKGNATTVSDGTYTITGLPEGTYTVTASATNFETKTVGATVDPNVETPISVPLDADPGSIGGTITESGGTTPISGATVVAKLNGDEKGRATTAPDGTYTITGLPEGTYTVTVTATNFEAKTVGATVDPNAETPVSVPLDADPGSMGGTITESGGTTPIGGATVVAKLNGDEKGRATTAPDGTYKIAGLPEGTYTVTVTATNFETKTVGATVDPNVETPVSVPLDADPGSIGGTITESDGTTPISGAIVVAKLNGDEKGRATTAPEGTYKIAGLAEGTYTVTVTATNFEAKTVGATVDPNIETPVSVPLDADPGSIGGTITESDGTTPISGATVVAKQNNDDKGHATTATDGTYTIPGLAEGTYTVTVTATDFETKLSGATVDPNAETTVNLSLDADPGSIGGTITESDGTTPIGGAKVEAKQGHNIVKSETSGTDGSYQIDGLSPGDYTVRASELDFQPNTGNTTVSSDKTATVNLSLDSSPGSIGGYITEDDNVTPIPGAKVEVYLDNVYQTTSFSETDGSYTVRGLAPDSYLVTYSAPLFELKHEAPTVLSNTITSLNVSLDADPGSIAGVVMQADGSTPVAGATVDILKNGSIITFAISGTDGTYKINGLAPGDYSVRASSTIYDPETLVRTIISDQTATANFSLSLEISPPQNLRGSVVKNKFFLQEDLIHKLTWNKSPSVGIVDYKVYRNGEFIGNVLAGENPLQYFDYDRRVNVADSYVVIAENIEGSTSTGAQVSIQ